MVIKYNDPYGNRKYAQLKGDKGDSYFKIVFSEAVIHKADDGYVLFGQVDEYQGVVRSFKPENPIQPGLCIVPFYSQEYEIRKKDKDGSYSAQKMQPSIFEKTLCSLVSDYQEEWMPYNASIKGHIAHIPDSMLSGQDATGVINFVQNSVSYEQIDSSGNIPDYDPSSSGSYQKSYSGYKRASIEDKLAFIKKELCDSIKASGFTSEAPLGSLVSAFNSEHQDDENYVQLYFDLLVSIIR